jgi:hypothetical protein
MVGQKVERVYNLVMKLNLTNRSLNYLALSALILLGAACTPKKDQEPQPNLRQSLVDTVKSIQGTSEDLAFDACDLQYNALKMRAAEILDRRAGEITDFMKHLPINEDKAHYVNVGPTQLSEEKEFKIGNNEWQPDIRSWSEVAKLIENAQGAINWDLIDMNSIVRSLLLDDLNRIQYWENKDLDHEAESKLRRILSAVQMCSTTESCQSLNLSVDDTAFYNHMSLYATYHPLPTSRASKRFFEELERRLKRDLERFDFTKRDGVHALSPGVLQVDMDSGAFSGAEEFFNKIATQVWSRTSDLTLNIKWQNTGDFHPFKMIFEPLFGSRSYVHYSTREMHLFPQIPGRVFGHELGHVLGFSDNYHVVFHRDVCGYDYQTNMADVMSSSRTGVATADEITKLLQNYH